MIERCEEFLPGAPRRDHLLGAHRHDAESAGRALRIVDDDLRVWKLLRSRTRGVDRAREMRRDRQAQNIMPGFYERTKRLFEHLRRRLRGCGQRLLAAQ